MIWPKVLISPKAFTHTTLRLSKTIQSGPRKLQMVFKFEKRIIKSDPMALNTRQYQENHKCHGLT
jgi:hypothetical protein